MDEGSKNRIKNKMGNITMDKSSEGQKSEGAGQHFKKRASLEV